MNRRTFLKTTGAGCRGAHGCGRAWPRPRCRQAKITRIRFYEAPNVMPLQIPLLQSNMVVTIETDANITGIGEGGTLDTLAAVCRPPDRQEPVRDRAAVAGHVSRLPLSARARAAARDRRARPRVVGPERQSAGRARCTSCSAAMNRNHLECYTTTFRGGRHAARSRRRSAWRRAGGYSGSTPPSVQGTSTYDTRERMRQMAGRLPRRPRRRRPDGQLHGRLPSALHASPKHSGAAA